jgi:3-oxoacyl-[acyl-carrier-protein] synthase II
VKVMARDIEIAVAAARLAVEDAGLVTRGTLPEDSTDATTYPSDRVGCHIGAGLIAAETDELTAALSTARTAEGRFEMTRWGTIPPAAPSDAGVTVGGMNNLTPLWMLKYLPNMLACHVTIIHGAEGPSNTITAAQASGMLSMGESARAIERGAADLCFSGGAESKLNLMGLLRAQFAGRLARSGNAEGAGVVRPFDPASSGTLIGEGGAILILEDASTAQARGAGVYAEIAGFGAGQSGPAPTVLGENEPELAALAMGEVDDGLANAISAALADAKIAPAEIDAIVPLALGVPALDEAEATSLRRVFGARLAEVPLITLTPFVGDAYAGQGSLQVAAGALAIKHQMLPARLHAGTPAAGLLAGASPARAARLRNVLVCAQAQGGQNAALVLRAP